MTAPVSRVINAAGKMTALGGSAQSEAVAATAASAARVHVDMAALRAEAGRRIAARCGAEAASVTSGAAAGIAIAVAACISGTDFARMRRLPDSEGVPNRVVMQAGHNVDFGAPVTQMVRVGGGVPYLAGQVNHCTREDLRSAFDGNAAALLYVQSHHAVQTGQQPLARCVELARAAGVPVIVDAAAEEDLGRYLAQGANLVVYSGGKAIGGPTSGFVAGDAGLIEACELQQQGIARAMKVGKEAIAGLLAALEDYDPADEARLAARRETTGKLFEALSGIEGLRVELRRDESGREIQRVAVHHPAVRDLVAFLRHWNPPIHTRNHHIDAGFVSFDPRELAPGDVGEIRDAVAAWKTSR